jgi:hypothetical protein
MPPNALPAEGPEPAQIGDIDELVFEGSETALDADLAWEWDRAI